MCLSAVLFVFRRARQLTNISAEQERFACQCDRQCRYARASSIFYSMINARFNERQTDANRGDILSSHDRNQIHVHNQARVHTVSYVSVIIELFWSFCVINMPKRQFFFESLDPSMMKPYRLVFITNVRGACAFVQSRRVTQSFGVDKESRYLRTPTN